MKIRESLVLLVAGYCRGAKRKYHTTNSKIFVDKNKKKFWCSVREVTKRDGKKYLK